MAVQIAHRLLGGLNLDDDQRGVLHRTIVGSRSYGPGATIVEGGCSRLAHLMVTGWAAERRLRANGGCQITALYLGGDLCDLTMLGVGETVTALTRVEVALLDRAALNRAMEHHPQLAQAMLRLVERQHALLKAWVGCFGLRDRREHLAHLLCELHCRLHRKGIVRDGEFELPLTQVDLSNVLGISLVHTNRMLQALRREGLIALNRRRVRILHPQRLRQSADFDEAYLDA